jgi:L-rhamnose mutarotase
MEIALHTRLLAEREADYDEVHRTIPADLARALTEAGVRDWRIWRDGRDLFHLIDVEDYQAMRRTLRDHPANLAWQRQSGALHDTHSDSSDGRDTAIDLVWSLRDQCTD